MHTNYIEKLEFDFIRENISSLCTFYLSKRVALEILPYFDKEKINLMQLETQEAREFIEKEEFISFSGISKITPLDIPMKIGHLLSGEEIFQTMKFLKLSNSLKSDLSKNNNSNLFSNLNKLSNNINNFTELIDSINHCIDETGEVKNAASNNLSKLRKNSLKSYSSLNKLLNKIVSDRSKDLYFQSSSIRAVSGRLALEVKSEYKSKVKGIIHGSSSTNQTVYVEPISAVESCNKWIESLNEVKQEEKKVLFNLSKNIIINQKDILENVETVSKIDLIFAKAKFSKEIDGFRLISQDFNEINLIECRHPILGSEAIPINIKMNKKVSTIIISGPNTGGKTVTLKTIGIIALMNQSGIQVPCSPSSKLPIFTNLFVHIGDDQDLQKSQSSFSAHISSLISTLKKSSEGCLVLIDEIASSTDPDEGMALACSIMEHLNKSNCKTIISTHIKGIINYGENINWCQNYSVSFDEDKNIPTYKLIEGVPSNSFAINISRNLGMPEKIAKNAEKMLSEDFLSYKKLISELEKNKLDLRNKEEELEKNKLDLRNKEEELDKELKEIKDQKEEILSHARDSQTKKIKELEKELKKIKDISNTPAELKSNKKHLKKIKNEILNTHSQNNLPKLSIGEYVKLEGLSGVARVAKIKSKRLALFKIGGSIVEMPIAKIISKVEIIDNSNRLISYNSKSGAIKTELDLRGIEINEIEEELEKYLDSSIINNLKTCQIIHGEGAGILKNEVVRILTNSGIVQKFYPHKDRRGVTIVEII